MVGFQLCRNVGLQLSYSQRKEQEGRLSWSFVSAVPEKPGCCPLQGRGHGGLEDFLPSGLLSRHYKCSWDSKKGRTHPPPP